MSKFVLTSLLVAFSAFSFGQEDIKLGNAKAVDIHVIDVQWQPTGRAMIYRRQEENGFGLGVYSVGNYEGKVVIPISKSDTWDTNWLAGSNSAIITVRSQNSEAKTKSARIKIYLVDADRNKATVMFDQTFEEKLIPSVDVDTSPSLKHAIVTMRNSQGSAHKVLCLGGGSLVDSPDLDRAEKEGMSGPSWSLDGTAIYSNAKGGVFRATSDKFNGDVSVQADDSVSSSKVKEAFIINISTVTTDVNGANPAVSLSGLKFKFMAPTPPTGSSVMELMTGSPILRPVRFRGPWISKREMGPKLVPQSQSLILKFDQSNAQDNSVWLTRGTVKGVPATLVAVHVSDTWLPDSKNGIAYVIDGALFFRSIGQ